jgi:hypothetical protein
MVDFWFGEEENAKIDSVYSDGGIDNLCPRGAFIEGLCSGYYVPSRNE